jgi:predicted dehydrogenase
MTTPSQNRQSLDSRRDFLKKSTSAVAGASLASAIAARSYAAEDNTIQIALIGCGGRGTGAAVNALSTAGPTKLVAMADVFPAKIYEKEKSLKSQFQGKVDVPEDCRYVGTDAYKKAIDQIAPGGLVILATPPAFRPLHLEYAVAKGVHVFMEKSFAVDAPGIRRVLKAGEEATKKNLKIAGGLMSRHSVPLEQAIEKLHEGIIGDLITCWAYRMHGPVGFRPRREDESELANQIRNYSCYTWLNGSFILDWLIHNLDVCCWAKDAWPVSAQGQGGRIVRDQPDQLYDHYAVQYKFPDGTCLFAQGRHIASCWGFFGDIIHGTTGSAVIGEGQPKPKIYKGHQQTPENMIWEFTGASISPYQHEHDLLFQAIREDKPYNETQRCAYAAMTGILGRMAAESGQEVTWEEAISSSFELAPGLDDLTMHSPAPVQTDASGNYPVALPGISKVY